MPPKTPHFRELDALRGLAAQFVVIAHLYNALFPVDGWAQLGSALGWLARLSVIYFFVLSGFAIATAIQRGILRNGSFDWLDFAIRRVARIYPPFLAAILLVSILTAFSMSGLLALGVETPPNFNVSAGSWLRTVVFLFTSNDAITAYDGVVWSLRIEVGLYFLAALLAIALFATGIWRFAVASVIVIATVVFSTHLAFAVLGIALFASGAVAALWMHVFGRVSAFWIPVGVVCLLALPMAFPSLSDDSYLSLSYQCALGVPIALSLLYVIHQKVAASSRVMGLLVASGGWSYTLYLTHVPVLLAARALFDGRINLGIAGTIAAALCYFVLANLVAYLIARYLERPAYFARIITNALAMAVTVIGTRRVEPK